MLERLRDWSRWRLDVLDALWVLPMIAISVPQTGPGTVGDRPVALVLFSVALIVPLFWRRRAPLVVFTVIALVALAQWAADVGPMPADLAVLQAMFVVAKLRSFRWAVAAGLACVLGVFLAVLRWWTFETPDGPLTGPFVALSSIVAAAWLGGVYVNIRRRYLEGLEERARRAELERDQHARIAIAAERARIARELHDVIAHNLSVMVVQADGAGYALDHDKELARQAVQTIAGTGRQALGEMRRLLGVLREGESDGFAPQPGLDQLGDLVAQCRAVGLPVTLDVRGERRELPQGLELTIYRVVQEGLTNTLKHGGPGATASVELAYGDAEVSVSVSDDGRGAAARPDEPGHGLTGMRERVTMYGGAVSARPRPGGGFQVQARFPVHAR
ncbi:sensor histidine kinase [Bailinhaonella thermotolerans]|uniref:histidine kinase n=1 Tax=Bailinhaonella thermotolerans TaxID=1070861 RepID=A0A3A4AVJ7_9ACTN|nr:histidine kinase [Bailinhaonella thermotolerans]RJL32377.1 sensor histidine kinase [Bailinhaonella thermotolerans]